MAKKYMKTIGWELLKDYKNDDDELWFEINNRCKRKVNVNTGEVFDADDFLEDTSSKAYEIFHLDGYNHRQKALAIHPAKELIAEYNDGYSVSVKYLNVNCCTDIITFTESLQPLIEYKNQTLSVWSLNKWAILNATPSKRDIMNIIFENKDFFQKKVEEDLLSAPISDDLKNIILKIIKAIGNNYYSLTNNSSINTLIDIAERAPWLLSGKELERKIIEAFSEQISDKKDCLTKCEDWNSVFLTIDVPEEIAAAILIGSCDVRSHSNTCINNYIKTFINANDDQRNQIFSLLVNGFECLESFNNLIAALKRSKGEAFIPSCEQIDLLIKIMKTNPGADCNQKVSLFVNDCSSLKSLYSKTRLQSLDKKEMQEIEKAFVNDGLKALTLLAKHNLY